MRSEKLSYMFLFDGKLSVVTGISRAENVTSHVDFPGGGAMDAPEVVITLKEESEYGDTEETWHINRN